MKSILEKLEEKSISKERALQLVEIARARIEAGESPADVLCSYDGPLSEEEILSLLPDE